MPTINPVPRPFLANGRPGASNTKTTSTTSNPTPKSQTTLQRHVDFFDGNKDGKITIQETRQGLRSLGLGSIGALFGALFINLGLSSKTDSGSSTVIEVNSIAKAKHDNDSGVLDANGQFDPVAFNAMFEQYDANRSGSLSAHELATMRAARFDSYPGELASAAEFGLLLKIAADTQENLDGKPVPALSRQRLQALYDGTLFPALAEAHKAKAEGR